MVRPVLAGAILFSLLGSAASLPAQARFRTVRGEVRDTAGNPLDAVDIILLSGDRVARTGSDGRFVFDSVEFGMQRFLFRRVGYNRIESAFLINQDDEEIVVRLTPVAFTLDPIVVSARRTGLFGVVGDALYQPMAGAEVEAFGGGQTVTDSTGHFSLPKIRPGSYLLQVRKRGYYALRRSITVPRGEYQELSVLLLPIPSGLRGRRLAEANGFSPRVGWALGESAWRRVRCSGGSSVLIPREELAEAGGRGRLDLVLSRTRTAVSKGYGEFELRDYQLFLDGQNALGWPLAGIHAEDVEAVEIYKGYPNRRPPPPANRSMGGAFSPRPRGIEVFRDCPKATIWVWMR